MQFQCHVGLACVLLLLAGQIGGLSASAWSYRWRSLNQSSSSGGGGGLCAGTVRTDSLAEHFKEAVIDIALYQVLKDNTSADVPETCQSVQGMLDIVSRHLDTRSVCLNPHGMAEMLTIKQYLRVLQRSEQGPPATMAATLAAIDYRVPATASDRGFFDSPSSLALTTGPAESELVHAVYSTLLSFSWSYVGLVWEAEPGAERLSQQLRASAQSDRRVCFPLLLSFRSDNVTDAARALKDFAYTAKRLSRFTVVYVGSGSAFLSLWDLVAGSEGAYSDSEKRYQFAVVGEAFSSYHRMSSPTRHGNLALGTVFIFPGILDPDPSTDELQLLFSNITSDPASMGRFTELRDTHARLKSLKDATSSLCTWHDANNFCYQLALRYDFLALGLASLLADGAPTLSTLADVQNVQKKEVSLTALRANFTILNSFIKEGFTTYSLHNGLQHSSHGYWQPIVKVYQSQLSGSSYALKKLGELRMKQAGTPTQTYEFDLSTNSSQFYQLTGGDPGIPPVPTSDSASECPSSCPECVGETKRQFIQFREGDIYLGALVPVFYKGNDAFDCTDGSFREKTVGGYEFAMAFKFVVDLVDSLSQESPTFPAGFDVSKVDQQFLLGVKDLLQRVHDRRTKRLRWGYVVLDTCYSPSCTVRRLGSLLDGSMGVIPGFNFTKVVGFVGSLSSTQTMASSQLLKMYNLPLITYGSTSTALSDVSLYPYVLRTVSSDTVIIEAMVAMLKHLKVNYISIMYAPTAYGMSLRDEMKALASREGICISKLIPYDCGRTDDSCKANKLFTLKETRARYVPFLSSLQDLISLLSYTQAETEMDYLTLLTTESVGVSDEAFKGKRNVGLGTLSLKLVSPPSPALATYINYSLTRVPPNGNNISEWDRQFFEDAQQCYLRGSFIRNSEFTQACLQALVERHPITDVESRSPLVIDAASTLVLGSLTAMTYLCQVTTPEPACPAFFAGDYNSMLRRANLVMYGAVDATDPKPQGFSGSDWAYRKIFDNRMGRTPISMWQYQKLGSVDYRFVQIGLFNGANSSTFSKSLSQLTSMERRAGGSSSTPCRSRADCGFDIDMCANTPGPAASPPTPQPNRQLGLLGLLFIPGFLLGFLPVCFINLARNGCPGPAEVEYAYYDAEAGGGTTQQPAPTDSGGAQNGHTNRASSGQYESMHGGETLDQQSLPSGPQQQMHRDAAAALG